MKIDGDDESSLSVLATFTTRESSIPGSAVCAFRLSDIQKSLLSPLKDATGPAPWSNNQEHPANCQSGSEARTNRGFLEYISENSPEVQEKPPAINGEPLLTRTVFKTAADRDLLQKIEVTPLDGAKDLALVAIGTSNSKIIRASLKLTADKDSIVHRKRLTFLTEQAVHPENYCGEQANSGVLDIQIQKVHQSIIISGQSCTTQIYQGSTCQAYSCQSACASSADPMCFWNKDSKNCQALDRNSRKKAEKNSDKVSHEYFNPCAAETTPPVPIRTSTHPTESTIPIVIQPSYEKPIKFDSVEETPNMSMSRDPQQNSENDNKNHWVTTVITLAIALVVGLALGAIATISCYKYRTRNRDSKGPASPLDYDSSKIEVSEPILPFREPRKQERIGSLYENIRLESNSSDSSRDSGIRMSGDSNPDSENMPNSRLDHEFHANTTGRIRQRPDQLPLKPQRLNYSTLTYTPANHFGSMKYSTTARGSSARTLSSTGHVPPTTPTGKSQPKLGINSIHYATMQPKYNRAQSCPNGQRKPIMPVSFNRFILVF